MENNAPPRIFLFVPDGIGVRNYLFSDLISQCKNAHVGMFHTLPINTIAEIENIHKMQLEVHEIPAFYESTKERILHDVATFARLMRNSRIRKNIRIWKNFYSLKISNKSLQNYYRVVVVFSTPISYSLKAIQFLDNALSNSYAKGRNAKGMYEMIAGAKPDVILCTHQRMPVASLMATVAAKLNIPVVSAIFSWDNLPKSRITLKANHYIVWSDYMRKEIGWYYPEISVNSVHVTGTPQFECYKKTELHWSKEAFCNKYGIPTNKKLVLLSGNDLTSPNDQYYFEDIAQALAALPENERPHLLLRKAPVDRSDRFKEISKNYSSFITTIDPLWQSGDPTQGWTNILPTYDDVVLLTNLCLHCHLVVNIGSTMGLDFAQFDKPAVYIHYSKPYNASWYDINAIYRLEHFRTLENLDAVLWIKSKEDILPIIKKGLESPATIATDRLKWRKLLTNDIENASSNIAALLQNLATNRKSK